MKSKRAAVFDDVVFSGPGQVEFEERIYAEEKAKRWPRVSNGTGTFEDQVVIVTGAATGQGEIEAKMFAQQGAKVYMTDINDEGLEQVKAIACREGLPAPLAREHRHQDPDALRYECADDRAWGKARPIRTCDRND